MKNLMIFGIFIICLVAAQFTFAQTTDEVVDKYITALGGKEKLLSLNTIKMTGSMNVQGADVAIVVTKKNGIGARNDISVMGTENYEIVNVEKSVRYYPIQGQSAPEDADAEQHQTNLRQLDLAGSLVNYKEKGHKIDFKGNETIDGVECHKLLATFKNGKTLTYFIDTKTGRLLKTTTMINANGTEMESPTTFADYKQNADGYWFAYSVTSLRGETIYSTIETNIKVDDNIFKVN